MDPINPHRENIGDYILMAGTNPANHCLYLVFCQLDSSKVKRKEQGPYITCCYTIELK